MTSNLACLGVEIGGTKLQVVRGDGHGRIIERRRMAVEPGGAGAVRNQIAAAVSDLTSAARPAAIGVGFGGPVNIDTGQVALSYQVEGWGQFPIARWLADLTGVPVAVDNDANVAALGEALRGAGRGRRIVFYTNLGSGMGGGTVIDGQIYHGARPGESEIGLMPFDKTGATVESRCCGWAVDRKIRDHAHRHPDSALARLTAGSSGGEARHLMAAIAADDSGAAEILRETAGNVAFALALAAHLFHPEILIIGGGLSLIGEPLRAAIAADLPRLMTAAFKPGPPVALAELGEDVVCVGALLLAHQLSEQKG